MNPSLASETPGKRMILYSGWDECWINECLGFEWLQHDDEWYGCEKNVNQIWPKFHKCYTCLLKILVLFLTEVMNSYFDQYDNAE